MTPLKVTEAQALARRAGFHQSCIDETGQLLAVLASSMRDAPILEIGSGFGVGTAWLASTARVRVVTAESDPERARGVRALMRDVPGVVVVHGDWAEALPHGPFGLIFVDANMAKHDAVDTVIGAMIPGGLVLLDDLTPKEKWPAEWVGQPDALRDRWLTHPSLWAVEIRTGPDQCVIVASKVDVQRPTPYAISQVDA